jgi:hypothetical protein
LRRILPMPQPGDGPFCAAAALDGSGRVRSRQARGFGERFASQPPEQ